MNENKSPWIEQLQNNSSNKSLDKNIETDTAIIGAGISGITSAYFILKNTKLSVCLLEAKKLASGATGHNAGQMVSYFEKQITNLVKEFGFDLAVSAQKDINSSWYLLEEIFQDTGINTKVSLFTGYAGIQSLEDLLLHLQNAHIYKKAGLIYEKLSISDDCPYLEKIPTKYQNLFSVISKKNLLDYLETKENSYYAMISIRKGVMNSAVFCEDLLNYMIQKYPNRFRFYENTPVDKLNLLEDKVESITTKAKLVSKKVVLCTNGFEKIKINNQVGKDIDTKFHHLINGCIGYMAAYLEQDLREPTAISYLPQESSTSNPSYDINPYFYLTRRDFELKSKRYNLICVGGPEAEVTDTNNYKTDHPYPKEAQENIDKFLHSTYKHSPKAEIEYKYKWHGLMGYTPNGIRLIGPEPLNKNLLYNLGCNGIGILPSIFGSKKISLILKGEKFPKSIFDPSNINLEEINN